MALDGRRGGVEEGGGDEQMQHGACDGDSRLQKPTCCLLQHVITFSQTKCFCYCPTNPIKCAYLFTLHLHWPTLARLHTLVQTQQHGHRQTDLVFTVNSCANVLKWGQCAPLGLSLLVNNFQIIKGKKHSLCFNANIWQRAAEHDEVYFQNIATKHLLFFG